MSSNEKEGVCYPQPKSLADRVAIARSFVDTFGYTLPLYVDDATHAADELHAGWPERLYVIDEEGMIAYKSKAGPSGCEPDELKAWLAEQCGNWAAARESHAPVRLELGAPRMLIRLAKLALILFAVFAGLVLLQILRNAGDLWDYYFDNPEMLRDVRLVEGPLGSTIAARVANDFDGDGVADQIGVEYLHMEPLFSDDATSGLLRVRSGKDGSDLLVFPTATPMASVAWAGDLDGNGTDDLRVTNDRRDVSLLHDR